MSSACGAPLSLFIALRLGQPICCTSCSADFQNGSKYVFLKERDKVMREILKHATTLRVEVYTRFSLNEHHDGHKPWINALRKLGLDRDPEDMSRWLGRMFATQFEMLQNGREFTVTLDDQPGGILIDVQMNEFVATASATDEYRWFIYDTEEYLADIIGVTYRVVTETVPNSKPVPFDSYAQESGETFYACLQFFSASRGFVTLERQVFGHQNDTKEERSTSRARIFESFRQRAEFYLTLGIAPAAAQ